LVFSSASALYDLQIFQKLSTAMWPGVEASFINTVSKQLKDFSSKSYIKYLRTFAKGSQYLRVQLVAVQTTSRNYVSERFS
jgi:hypothetical protein